MAVETNKQALDSESTEVSKPTPELNYLHCGINLDQVTFGVPAYAPSPSLFISTLYSEWNGDYFVSYKSSIFQMSSKKFVPSINLNYVLGIISDRRLVSQVMLYARGCQPLLILELLFLYTKAWFWDNLILVKLFLRKEIWMFLNITEFAVLHDRVV